MIPEYKFYHGSVLAELTDAYQKCLSIETVQESGRPLYYVLNGAVGIVIKYSTQRLRPWRFSFSTDHLRALERCENSCHPAFLVLVCKDDGIIAIETSEILPALAPSGARQSWLRADRKKREMYRIFTPTGELSVKYRINVEPVIDALNQLDLSKT